MIIFLILLFCFWVFYAVVTGQFSKENKEKRDAKLKKDWAQLKQDFKRDVLKQKLENTTKTSDIPGEILSKKQRNRSQQEREKYANDLANKLGTRSEVLNEEKRKLQAQKDYEYTLKLLGKSKTYSFENDSSTYTPLPKIPFYRYVLEYKNAYGSITIRGIDITHVHKGYYKTRWYFDADTDDGERTFKSQRVIRLKDQNTGITYDTAKEIREHILGYNTEE